MASRSLQEWQGNALAAFEEFEGVHDSVDGARSGRPPLLEPFTHLYVVLLAARFQGFARALHTETANVIATNISTTYRVLVFRSLTHSRALDRQNAQPSAITEGFDRFAFEVWPMVDAMYPGNEARRRDLGRLIGWRNAIVHHDIDEKLGRGTLAPKTVTLDVCRRWRTSLEVLARSLDTATADQCKALGFPRPW